MSDDWAHAGDAPLVAGNIRQRCADFAVSEILGFEPDGHGDHLLLYVQKQGITTADLVSQVARYLRISRRDIGYCGMKDRWAVARQWLSIPRTAQSGRGTGMGSVPLTVLARARHRRKLRRGSHRGNAFRITVRDVRGSRQALKACLARIACEGVPNYFGPQRFGHRQQNIERGVAMLQGHLRVRNRHLRSMYFSALRAWLFNVVLSERVIGCNWNRLLAGDCAMLDGTHSVFKVGDVDAELVARVCAGDVHPTGPLPGAGDPLVRSPARDVEAAALAPFAQWCIGLERAGLQGARRALRARVRTLNWQWECTSTLQVSFTLDRGQFATSVLRECLHAHDLRGAHDRKMTPVR